MALFSVETVNLSGTHQPREAFEHPFSDLRTTAYGDDSLGGISNRSHRVPNVDLFKPGSTVKPEQRLRSF